MGLIGGFGRTAKPKTFTYIPQYYDERKERLDNLMRDFDADSEESTEAMKARIKMSYTSRPYYYDKTNTASKLRRKSNFRVFVIIAVLLILAIVYLGKFGTPIQDLVK